MIKNKTIILIFIFFLGCGRMGEKQKFFAEKDPSQSFSQMPNQESFIQEKSINIKRPFIDILFVVDNSGSMQNEQIKLANNFDTFIDYFLKSNIDFKIGIITSDSADNIDAKEKLTSTEAKADETKFKELFKKTIKVGIRGEDLEKPAFYSKKFFENNPNWVNNKDAYLAVIIISDEDDSSKGVNLVEYLKDIKREDDLVKIFAIVTTNDHSTMYGKAHIEKAEATGGSYQSILEPFDKIFDNLGKTITELATRLKMTRRLSTEELEKIIVIVDNFDVGKEAWRFDDSSNTIIFNEGHTPSSESKIEIILAGLRALFILKKKLDVSRIETIDLRVDGQPVPKAHWKYREKLNAIEFLKGHIPQMGSTIKVQYTDEF